MQKVLFLGRFQPFHNGHIKVIKDLSKQYEVVIAIGSAKRPIIEFENPFTFEERIKMVKNTLKANNLPSDKTFVVPDISDDSKYVEHVESFCGKCDFVCTGNDWVKNLFANKGYKILGLQRFDHIYATEIRESIANGKEWESKVPKEVADIIKECDCVKRLRELLLK